MSRRTTAIVFGALAGSALLVGPGVMLASNSGSSATDDAAKSDEAKKNGHNKPGNGNGTPAPGQSCLPKHDDDDDDHDGREHDGREHDDDDEGREEGRRSDKSGGARSGAGSARNGGSHDDDDDDDDDESDHHCRPVPGPSGSPSGSPTSPNPSPTATMPTTPAPSTSPTAACTNYTGAAGIPKAPGDGTVTVTIKVCNGVITTATAAQVDNSGYGLNLKAIPALNTLAVQYYKTDLTKIAYTDATLTAAAYRTSLQSAMTKAGL